MAKEANFEQLRFDSVINTINRSDYPKESPKHWHQYVELVAVLEESKEAECGTIKVNQQSYELSPGDILLIWPGELHEVVKNEYSTLIGLQFSLNVLTQSKDFALYVNLFKKYHYLSASRNPELTKKMMGPLKQLFQVAQEKNRQFQNVEMVIRLYEMMIEFGKYIKKDLDAADSIEHRDEQMLEKIHSACDYIQQNCDKNLTLESVANYIGFSPCYFSRSFKRMTGYHFVEYLLIQRVKRLQILLTEEELTITEAAYQAGFRSLSTLNRVFKQYCGCAPREYKKYYSSV